MAIRRRGPVFTFLQKTLRFLRMPKIATMLLAIVLLSNPNSQSAYAQEANTFDVVETSNMTIELKRQNKLCEDAHSTFQKDESEIYCNPTFDQYLCWGYAKAGTTITQNCPNVQLLDSSHKARRHCGINGTWLDRNNESSITGWTDYISCFAEHMQGFMNDASKSVDRLNAQFTIARYTRIVEFIALPISCLALIVALFLYYKYPRLLNHRTRIHRHLFSILLTLGITTLLIYTEQATMNILPQYNMLCVSLYILLELFTSISFSFMFIEGLHLYFLVRSTALRPPISYRQLLMAGYIVPTAITLFWAVWALNKYGWRFDNCWFGYNLDPIYWILQIPRLLVILANVTFILIVIKILVEKLTTNDVTEVQRIRKVVRATVLLMPLLGITNFISLTNAPLRDTTEAFAVWALFAYLFRSLQGFFVSVIYCFSNREVIDVVCRRPNATFNEPNERATRLKTTEVEPIRREDDIRLDIPENQLSIMAQDMPYIDMDPENQGEEVENIESYELQEVVVHDNRSPQVPEVDAQDTNEGN